MEQQPKKPAKVPQREFTSAQPAPSRTTHGQAPKRPAAAPSHAITKKPKLAAPYKEISIAEAARYGTLHDYAFFDKVNYGAFSLIYISRYHFASIFIIINLLTVSLHAETSSSI